MLSEYHCKLKDSFSMSSETTLERCFNEVLFQCQSLPQRRREQTFVAGIVALQPLEREGSSKTHRLR